DNPVDNAVDAIRQSLPTDAPREHARITSELNGFQTDNHEQVDLDTIAAHAGVQIHVLHQDGPWTAHGPVTGRPVHLVQSDVNGKPQYLATRESVQIGRMDVHYPGSTTTEWAGSKHLAHRGEFEVETIAGKHFVRLYTALANPEPVGSKYKDVHQAADGTVTITSGTAPEFWVNAGRPLRAIQWVAKYQREHAGKPLTPVLRSYLVPLSTFLDLTNKTMIEGDPEATARGNATTNVDQSADVNQFGVRGVDWDALRNHVRPGSLVTYAPDASAGYALQHLAGRQENLSDLYARLGLDADFDPAGLGHRNDPWFVWTRPQGSTEWNFGGFRNDPERLRGLAADLTKFHVGWTSRDANPATKASEALTDPVYDSVPGEPKAKGGARRAPTQAEKDAELNQFINTNGPPARNLDQIISVVESTVEGILAARIQPGTPVPFAGDQPVKVVGDAMKQAFTRVRRDLENLINKADLPPASRPPGPAVEERGLRSLITNGGPRGSFDAAVINDFAAKAAKMVVLQPNFGLFTKATENGQQVPPGLSQVVEAGVHRVVKAKFEQFAQSGDPAPAWTEGEQGTGKNAGWFSGKRADMFLRQVAEELAADPDFRDAVNGLGLTIDHQALVSFVAAKAGAGTTKSLEAITTTELWDVEPDALKQKIIDKVLPEFKDKIGKQLETRDLELVAKPLRTDIKNTITNDVETSVRDALQHANFSEVGRGEIDTFMKKVPEIATQAEIGSIIAIDHRRNKVDFNTRPSTDVPFRNEFGKWRVEHRKGYTQFNDPKVFERHQQVGQDLNAELTRQYADLHEQSAHTLLTTLLTGIDGNSSITKDSKGLARKFAEVVSPDTSNPGSPYRAGKTANPSTFSEHAQMVLNRFLTLTRHDNDADRFVSREALVKGILFHDMEKVNSKNQYGDGQVRHDREPEHLGALSQMNQHEGLWSNEREFRLVRAMVDADPFGYYLRGMGGATAQSTYEFIRDLAVTVGRPDGGEPTPDDVLEFFHEFHQYYQADFSSYMEKATFINDNTGEPETFDKDPLSGFEIDPATKD
ncbi:MAG TPA: hypothetical protein VF821_26995, partial [Lentzea sp.]